MAAERKTTEIKLRVTPAEKTAWQIAAEQRGVGLSKLIRDCVQESLWTEQNQRMDGSSLVDNAIRLLQGPAPIESLLDAEGLEVLAASDAEVEDSPVEQAVPTSAAESRVAKPWMFEARSSD